MKITKSFQHDKVQGFKFGSWPFGRPKMYAHCYFMDGMLIDTGHSNMRKEVVATLSVLPVDQIFITHHHEDHSGNIEVLRKHFNCPTFASSLCSDLMKRPPSISFGQWLTWGNRPADFDLKPQDQFIETPNHYFEIIPIPGHAIDMVCLYEANKGWLFSADLFVSEYIRYFMKSESVAGQIQSIKRVLELDFEIMFCGHNPQFENCKPKLKRKLDFFENFYGRVAELYHLGHSVNSIFKEMKLRRSWLIRILSLGNLSTVNMVKAVIRDEQNVKMPS